MNILSTQQMKQIEAQLLKVVLTPSFQLRLPKMAPARAVTTRHITILASASQSTQLEIRKVVSLADNIRCLSYLDPNAALKVFTMAVLTMIYRDRLNKNDSSDSLLLDAVKCSLYSPSVVLNSIKGGPINQSSNQMKALLATFFDALASHQSALSLDPYKLAQMILQDNEQLLGCFIIFYRCILSMLQVEGANNWKNNMNQKGCLQHLLNYFDLSYRQVGDLFLLYEEGVFLAMKEKEIVFGEYFENQGEREHEKKQLEIKSSIKFNMIQSYLVNVNHEEAARKKKGIVDSDLKLFNFMLDSCQEEVKSHPDTETPHFKDNEAYHFGKKKKEETITYRPEQVRFEFERLIKDESLQEIEPDDLINFNAQFDDSPSLGGEHLHFGKQMVDSPSSLDERTQKIRSNHPNLITVPKNRMSLADQPAPHNFGPSPLPQNRLKKAATEINADQHINRVEPHSNHKNYNIMNLNSCFCREIRMNRNNCFSKVVDFSFVPPNPRRSAVSPIPPKNVNLKANARTVTEQKSYTLNKQIAKEKKSQIGEERTPSFLKNLKKTGSLKPDSVSPQKEQVYPFSAQQIGREKHSMNDQGPQRNSTILPEQTQPRPKPQGLMKMKISDNQPLSSKKFQLYNTSNRGVMGQSSANWQTSSNFHQRHMTSASPLNQSKSTFIGQQTSKNTSPLKFFAPVQIIAPTVYVNSNGNDSNNNIVLKLSELHENSPKLVHRQHQSPFANKFQPNKNQHMEQIL